MKICKISMLGLGLISLLSACAPEVTKWTPAETPKENRVDRAVFTYTFPYPAHGKGMNSLEKAKFLEFLRKTILKPYAVNVTLEEYGGHSDKRLIDIERELLKYGVPSDLIHRSFDHVDEHYEEHHRHKHHPHKKGHQKAHHKTHAKALGSVVLVVVERFVVITPSCANFSEQIGDANQAYNASNFGCSTEANLGMMIADPRDLLRGRERDPYDGKVMAAGVHRYENDKIKPIAEVNTTLMQTSGTGAGGPAGGAAGGAAATGGGY